MWGEFGDVVEVFLEMLGGLWVRKRIYEGLRSHHGRPSYVAFRLTWKHWVRMGWAEELSGCFVELLSWRNCSVEGVPE